jgi:hypothetical protein
MAHHVTSKDIPADGEQLDRSKVGGLMAICAIIAVLGTLASILFLQFGPAGEWKGSYAFSWLFAFFYFLTLAMGGCFWTLLHNVTSSGWGTSVRRVMENLGFVFPFMIVLAIPLLLPEVQKYLYEWMTAHKAVLDVTEGMGVKEALHHTGDSHDHLLYKKYFFLNIPFWYLRFFLYFGALGLVIWLQRKWSIQQDTDPNPGTKFLFLARKHSTWGIPVMAVTLTFAAIDWVMALDYKWFSTMWGVYVFAGAILSSMAVILMTTILLRQRGYLKNVVTPEHDHIMGKLAFAFVVFWAYISFSQFFLIWYANITEETSYFLLRNTENWNTLSIGLVVLHFFAPFLLMIRSDVKKKHGFMLFMTAYLLVLHMLDVYHMVIPERGPSVGLVAHGEAQLWLGGGKWILDIVALVIVGAGFLYFFLRNLTSAALYPHRDPRILESANLHN